MPNQTCAAFDFDGTITTADSLRDFVLYVVGRGRFSIAVLRALPWLAGLQIGLTDRGTAKAHFLAATLGGMPQSRLEALASAFAADRLPRMVRADMLARIRQHKSLGHRLVLVSASPSVYLKHWAANAGFDAVLATELEFAGDHFAGSLASPNCWGPQKVLRLQQWFDGDRPQTLYAYGDSRGDREMLAFADFAWLRGSVAMPQLDAWPRKTPGN